MHVYCMIQVGIYSNLNSSVTSFSQSKFMATIYLLPIPIQYTPHMFPPSVALYSMMIESQRTLITHSIQHLQFLCVRSMNSQTHAALLLSMRNLIVLPIIQESPNLLT